jgi:tetratricopeptide (TPR) repeat protein
MSSEGKFEEVVTLLERHLREHPRDVESWLMLAQHSYWTGDIARTRRFFDRAVESIPRDENIRLAYARFSMETGDYDGALHALAPLGSDNADAEVIRGTIAWWKGDLGRAQRHFREALSLDGGHEEAYQSLNAIRADARPWIRIRGDRATDTQPLASVASGVEAGLFLGPLHAIGLDVRASRFELDDSATGATDASVIYRGYWPVLRLETDIAGGAVFATDETHLTGSFRLGARLLEGVRLDASWQRAPYRYTVASLAEPILKNDLQLGAAIEKRGWLGEAAGRLESFPDGNRKRVFYGWLLAPLVSTSSLSLHAGYAFGYQDTDEHRFSVTMASSPAPNRPPRWEGRYVPYHTPLDERVHSLTGNVRWRISSVITLTAGGAYGFVGSERAPFVYLAGRAPMIDVYTRSIHPWNARLGVAAALTTAVSAEFALSHMNTAWYEATVFGLSLHTRL